MIKYASAARRQQQFPTHRKYFRLKVVGVKFKTKITTELRRKADKAFDEVQKAHCFKRKKLKAKRRYFHYLFLALCQAHHSGTTVMFPRNKNHRGWSSIRQQVVDAVVEAGLAKECRAKPASNGTAATILVPTKKLTDYVSNDPWDWSEPESHKLVIVRDRETKEEIDHNESHPTAVKYRKRLQKINAVNSQYTITYRQYDPWSGKLERRTTIRPVHYASFTDDFEHHGRIYTGRFGHTGLRGIERASIEFNAKQSTELDFRSFHCLMLYHLAKINYRKDPYMLWGDETTPEERLMAKIAVNCMINADSEQSALSACNHAMSAFTTKRGCRKTGKDLEDAQHLYNASRVAGLKFAQVIPLALKVHHRIVGSFFQDMGIKLMNIDSAIALDVLYHFAKRNLPCLGVHDSFITFKELEADLIAIMGRAYERRLGFLPVISA